MIFSAFQNHSTKHLNLLLKTAVCHERVKPIRATSRLSFFVSSHKIPLIASISSHFDDVNRPEVNLRISRPTNCVAKRHQHVRTFLRRLFYCNLNENLLWVTNLLFFPIHFLFHFFFSNAKYCFFFVLPKICLDF